MNAIVPAFSRDLCSSIILVVDDTPENLTVLGDVLQPHYRLRMATSGQRALAIAASDPQPDLVLLDVMMPGMDGYAVLQHLREDSRTAHIPVIFVTAMDGMADEQRGLALGAADYITKPVRPPIVLARVRTQLENKQMRDWLQDKNTWLEAEVAQRMGENLVIQDLSIHALARQAETRDPETGNHLRRTQEYLRVLALRLQRLPDFAAVLTERWVAMLVKSAPLHDIGKVGIPDYVLLKPGVLTPDEWEIMKGHARLGSDAIEQAERDAVQPVEFLRLAKEIAHYHHEKWDGSGYPEGLAGRAIPISARLMALADVFDALISRRVYKAAYSLDAARAIIVGESGRHFDPQVVSAFVAAFDEFKAIAERYSDEADAALVLAPSALGC